MKFRNIEEALSAIKDEAAQDAWDWLETHKPMTAQAIRYLIEVAKVGASTVLEELDEVYEGSEPNAMRKMKLVIEAMEREG